MGKILVDMFAVINDEYISPKIARLRHCVSMNMVKGARYAGMRMISGWIDAPYIGTRHMTMAEP